MILPDVNLLLYAYYPRAKEHEPSQAWLERVLSEPELVGFPWMVLWAFLRISTNARVFDQPMSTAEAAAAVSAWIRRPNVQLLEPGLRHWEILGRLLSEGQVAGPLVTDAALAALAIEHGAVLCTTDRDFSRFPGLKWKNPIAPLSD